MENISWFSSNFSNLSNFITLQSCPQVKYSVQVVGGQTHHNINLTFKASDEDLYFLQFLSFILEGVLQLVICSLGVVGNTIAILMLLSKSLRNSFNKLIATLAIFDLIYLMTMLLESLRKLGLQTDYHVIISPYFLYPLNSISLMCSIYMTIGVTLERFMAVYHPLDYRSRQQDSTSHKHRIITYVCPLLCFSVIFNISKFFESHVVSFKVGNETYLDLDVTDLR